MRLRIRFHLSGLILPNIVKEFENFGVQRSRKAVHDLVQKADLQPANYASSDHIALGETVVRVNGQQYWRYAAINPATNSLALYSAIFDVHSCFHTDPVKGNRDAVVAVIIESDDAVDNIDQILSVSGFDIAVFGQSNYSLSIDRLGEITNSMVRWAKTETIQVALANDLGPRIEVGRPSEASEYYDEYGLEHFNLNTSLAILHDRWSEQGEEPNDLRSES